MMITLFIVYMNLSQSKNASFMQKMKSFRPVTMEKMPIIKQTTQRIESALNTNVKTIIPEEKRTTIPSPPSSASPSPPSPSPPSSSPSIPAPETGLYDFTTHTFTNAGAVGRMGPTLEQITGAYSSTLWAKNYITMANNDGIQLWTVPKTGKYTIRAFGSSANKSNSSEGVGHGRIIEATFPLKKGEIIRILVGQQGTYGPYFNSGGGGGTFISTNDYEPLIVAGGGGGRGVNSPEDSTKSADASSTTFGKKPFSNATAQGTQGSAGGGGEGIGGGGGGIASDFGAGGGGFYGDGNDCPPHQNEPNNATGGKSFVNSGIGGKGAASRPSHGGFGGGGGSGSSNAGGGGGYSGGGGGGLVILQGTGNGGYGGGGGSFSSMPMTDLGLNIANHGKVIITYQK